MSRRMQSVVLTLGLCLGGSVARAEQKHSVVRNNAAPPSSSPEKLRNLPPIAFLVEHPFLSGLLEWDRKTGTVIHFQRNALPFVELGGALRKGFRLLYNYAELPTAGGRYAFAVELPESPRRLVLEVIAPNGAREVESFQYRWVQDAPRPFAVKISDGDQLVDSAVDFVGDFPSRDWIRLDWLSAGDLNPAELDLGFASFSYHQTSQNPIRVSGLQVGGGYTYEVFPGWSVNGRVRLLALPVTTSGASASTRLFEAQLGVRRELPRAGKLESWVQLAYDYNTLFTPDKQYGFANIGGPRLDWLATYPLALRRSVRLELGVGLFNSDTSLLSLGNRQLDGRLLYVWRPLSGLTRWGVGVGVKWMSLQFSNGSAGATVPSVMGLISF